MARESDMFSVLYIFKRVFTYNECLNRGITSTFSIGTSVYLRLSRPLTARYLSKVDDVVSEHTL